MATPRAALRGFLTQRFVSIDSLRRFVRDNFEEVVPELSDTKLVTMAETFIGGLTERGLIPDLWPVLRAARPKYLHEIANLKASWTAAASGSPITPDLLESDDTARLDRTQLKAIYVSARKAKLERSRPALLVGISENVVRALPSVPRPEARLWADLDHLNRIDGDPPPLEFWLDNALMILAEGEDGSGFEQALTALKAVAAREAADVVTDEVDALEEDEVDVLERIVLPGQRPAILVQDHAFDLPESATWRGPLHNARSHIHKAIAATGRLNVSNYRSVSWLGSAFVVGEDIVCTARHIVDLVYSKDRWRDSPGGNTMSLTWNPTSETDASTEGGLPITDVLLVHPVLDVAFLRVPGASDLGATPLVFSHREPLKDALLARVTYVAQDPRVDMELQQRVFRGLLDGRKWVLPGKVMGLEEGATLFGKSQLKLAYDSSTLGGTSGSPVIELDRGLVLGVGVARAYLKANWAVPASEILRDPRVRRLGIPLPKDAPHADDPWRDAWSDETSSSEQGAFE